MSLLLGQPSGGLGTTLLQQSDGRVMIKTFQWDYSGAGVYVKPWADGILWSRSRFGLSDSPGILLGNDFQSTGRWDNDQQDILGGQQTRKLIGTTLDSSGAPLGSCTVQGFLTADDSFVGQCTSDSGGYFELPTSFAGNHYIVCYRAGSPDVAGTSVNTLVPV